MNGIMCEAALTPAPCPEDRALSKAPATRRLAAIMVMDVVGYSRLMGGDEIGTLDAWRNRREHFIEPVAKAHGGRLIKYMGDGALLEFSSAVDAVASGLDLQKKMVDANAASPQSAPID